MRSERDMKVFMMVGFVLFITIQFMPSSAQLDCWQKILTCLDNTTSPVEFRQQCCAPLLDEIINERECFCSIKPLVLQNATTAGSVSRILSLCTTSSFITLCPEVASSPVETPPPPPPVKFLEAPCWEEIDNCIGNNVNRSKGEPHLDPSSPTFNITEFLCCPLMQQTAVVDKHCFCSINTFAQENPSLAPNVTFPLSQCNIIADSAESLNSFCLGGAPTQSSPILAGESLSPSPAPPQNMTSLGLLKRLNGLRFAHNGKT